MVIAFAQIKGGVGKTALCILAARYLAALDKRVLVIDSDIQRYATMYTNADDQAFGAKSLARAIALKDLRANIHEAENWDIVPADLDLIQFQCSPESHFYRRTLLPQAAGDYDYLLIDVPSGLDYYARNAAVAADVVVVPVIPASYEILAGITLIRELSDRLGLSSDRYRIVLNMFEGDPANPTRTTEELLAFLAQELGEDLIAQLVGDPIPRAKDIHYALQNGSQISDSKAHRKTYDALTAVMQTITLEASAAPPRF